MFRYLLLILALCSSLAWAQSPQTAEARLEGSEVPKRFESAVAEAAKNLGQTDLSGRTELVPEGSHFILRVKGPNCLKECRLILEELARPKFMQTHAGERAQLEEKLLKLRKEQKSLGQQRAKLIAETKLNPLGQKVEDLQAEISALEASNTYPEPEELAGERARLQALRRTYSEESDVVQAQLKIVGDLEAGLPSGGPNDAAIASKTEELKKLSGEMESLREKELTRLAGVDEALKANRRQEKEVTAALTKVPSMTEREPEVRVLAPPLRLAAPPPPEEKGRRPIGVILVVLLFLVMMINSLGPGRQRKGRRRKKKPAEEYEV